MTGEMLRFQTFDERFNCCNGGVFIIFVSFILDVFTSFF